MAMETFYVNDSSDNNTKGKYYSISLTTIVIFVVFVIIAITGLALGLGIPLANKSSSSTDNPTKPSTDPPNNSTQPITPAPSTDTPNNSTQPITLAPSTTSPPNINYRLSGFLVPFKYDILTIVQFEYNESESFPYEGVTTMHFECTGDTRTITFHALNLTIDSSSLELTSSTDDSFGTINNLQWEYDKVTEFVNINLNVDLKKGDNYSLTVKYIGYLQSDNKGFYRSSYIDSNGNKRWILTSQMEPTDARKSFPCFDEPDFKAIFNMSVIHPNDYHAMSNMPVIAVNPYNGTHKRTDFDSTPEMSSYLVALIVSDFVCINGTSNSGENGQSVKVSVCGRRNAAEQLEYALDIAVRVMNYFGRLYAVPYPLPKCDHVAVPDFSAGAMENWGLITYRESRLFFSEGETSQSTETSITTVIAHELAHMWFGDIVSPKWWNDLWLNEGFARYMQYIGTASVKPEWEMYDQLLSHIFGIMVADSVSSSHALRVDVTGQPEGLNEIFDDISYGKGAAVIRMTNYFISNETFNTGITNYLDALKFQNAEEDDLWKYLNERALADDRKLPADLIEMMHTWTRQMGYPVVNVKLSTDRTKVELSQKHFLLNSDIEPSEPSDYNYKWYIPFTHVIQKVGANSNELSNTNPNNLFDEINWILPNDITKTLDLDKALGADEFIVGNLDNMGFFRVNYDEENWNNIKKQFDENHELIPLRYRAQLINDAFGLAQAGELNVRIPLGIIEYLVEETEYFPWITTISRLGYFSDMLDASAIYSNFQKYLLELITPIYNKLTWEESSNDDWLTRLLRTSVIRFACERELPHCINEARTRYAQWMQFEDQNNIPASYRSLVYCYAIKYGGDKEWKFAQRKYKEEQDASSRNELQSGMSCATAQHLITQFLNDQLDESIVRKQDTLSGLRAAALRAPSSGRTWEFVKANWAEIFSRYGNQLSFARLFQDISTKLNTQQQYDDFEAFFNVNTNQGSATREIKISKDRIKTNIRWIKTNYKVLEEIFPDEPVAPVISNYRLPTELKPSLYDVQIKPYIGNHSDWPLEKTFTFDGEAKIHFKCVNVTNKLVFHIRNLTIKSVMLESTDDNTLKMDGEWQEDLKREFFMMNFSSNCMKDANYVFSVKYTGLIAEDLAGFYRSSYVNPATNKTEYLATTHFQPTDARRAFPCFDEPGMKAKFKLTLIRHVSFNNSYGNMPHDEFDGEIPGETNWRKDTFKESEPMSTYLVAFVIANFKSINNTSAKGIDIEVAARVDAIDANEGKHALEEATKIIDFFDDYFNRPYPLPKSTQIGVPDFNAGAMENWGLVIYRETQLLYNPIKNPISTKRRVSVVVSHELAHQWFGNLVTPKWWNDLWLNEGFASWVEYLGYNHTHPEWRDLDSFFVQRINVLVKDSLESSHPISVEVNNPAEINSLFDSISYDKGASIIRMMNAFLTEKTFRQGVSNYLEKYKFDNAIQDDLWDALTKQAHDDKTLDKDLTVEEIMNTWTLKKGYPLVTVTRSYNEKKVTLSQQWFLLDPNNGISQAIKDKQKWYVGFTHTTKLEKDFIFEAPVIWLKPNVQEVTVETNAGNDDWLIGNLLHSGYYRVNYDKRNWDLLIYQLNNVNHEDINEINRAQLLDDSFNIGKAGIISQTVFLDIAKYLEKEQSPIAWSAATSSLSYINSMLSTTLAFSNYKKFYTKLYKQIYEEYGWNSTVTDVSLIDLQLTSMASQCYYDNRECIQKAKDLYDDYMNNNVSIPANFKSIVYQTVIKYGNDEDWKKLFALASVETQPSDRLTMFRALAYTTQPYLLRYLLSETENDDVIKSQDATSIISVIGSNIAGRQLAWEHIENNWDSLLKRYGGTSFTLPNLVISVLQRFNTNSELERVKNFISKNPNLGVTQNAFKEAQETINININWMKNNYELIQNWLNENK